MTDRLPKLTHNNKTYAGHVVGLKGEVAGVLCVTYSLGAAGQNNAALFAQIGSEFPALPMPNGRALTFGEELRITGKASCVFDAGVARENEAAFLSAKLTEAYGPFVKDVTIDSNK